LILAIRGNFKYLFIFPLVTSFTLCIVSITDGKGSHDLIWVGPMGLFLLANVYTRKNSIGPTLLGILSIALFVATGIAEISEVIPNRYGTNTEHILLGVLYLSSIMGAITGIFHRHRNLLKIAIESKNEEAQIKKQYEEVISTLDQQVNARTVELDAINQELLSKTARLQAASDISQELTKIHYERNVDLLSYTTRLISEKLGYYHVGIFIVDKSRGFAVLQAANSKGGQQMLTKHHQLKVGGTGIVGYVAQSGRPRIALDTGADAVFFNNPYLPETRSEISLPIKVLSNVIGVLDVQSTQSAAFTNEDTNILMTIANQLALLLYEDESSTSTVSTVSRKRTQFTDLDKQFGYSFRTDGSVVSNTAIDPSPAIKRAIASGETVAINSASKDGLPMLAVPVKFREQVIGIIQVEASEKNRNWSEDEVLLVQAISDRAALALENARLFENATRRAEQEETISRVTTQIGSSTDFDRIMQTTIQELGVALGASRSFIQIGSLSNSDEKASE
ncbi:MAG TPA: GAF domain-containing protein, partial [Anaerolineales bacterium]|nr:GAF domain-containing protein [Anaerolineales bacterium]